MEAKRGSTQMQHVESCRNPWSGSDEALNQWPSQSNPHNQILCSQRPPRSLEPAPLWRRDKTGLHDNALP